MKNDQLYQEIQCRIALAYEIAKEGIVLLRNDGILPLKRQKLALFGRASAASIQGGVGSGASRGGPEIPLYEALQNAGYLLEEHLVQLYASYKRNTPDKSFFGMEIPADGVEVDPAAMFASGDFYEWFGRYSPPDDEIHITDSQIAEAADFTDTAIVVISRSCGGEECDRLPEDYDLLPEESRLVDLVCSTFPNVIVVSNEVGLIDLTWTDRYPSIRALLSMGPAGERGMQALADIISGAVTPSGKLGQTMVRKLSDHPATPYFSSNKENPESLLSYGDFGLSETENGVDGLERQIACVYGEDIYVGYRYFNTTDTPVYFPFGYGLSYTDFSVSSPNISSHRDSESISVMVQVKNIGSSYAGKEVVQVYLSAPSVRLSQPYKKLVGFEKTGLLIPGDTETVTITIPVQDVASYDESTACYILEPGKYILHIETGDDTPPQMGAFLVCEEIVVQQLHNHLSPKICNQAFPFLRLSRPVATGCKESFVLYQKDVSVFVPERPRAEPEGTPSFTSWEQVLSGQASVEAFADQLTAEEMAVLCVGLDSGLFHQTENVPLSLNYPDGTPIGTKAHPTGRLGSISPGFEKYGLPSVCYSDGPAGLGGTAWPVELVQARTWNKTLLREFGKAVGAEALEKQVDAWLAPAININRFVLGGRTFEYYSEDPILSGLMAAEVVTGIAAHKGITACPKHFALNEQETYRRGSVRKKIGVCDSIVSERAAREVYLKPFELAIRTGKVHCIMTSFNKINGTFAGGRRDLCTRILREEWGFQGAVITDWGDMDFVVNSGDAVHAGNDITMPGGPRYSRQILDALQDGRLSTQELRQAVIHILTFIAKTNSGNTIS